MIRFSLGWLCSRRVRVAIQMRHQIRKCLNAQLDLLDPASREALEVEIREFTRTIQKGTPRQVELAMQQADRLTYNFRRPRRGETNVFQSTGVPDLTPNTHYIKRLVGLGGERVRIGDDRHVYINGEPLNASDPGFEFVYWFKGPPRQDSYSGHVNGKTAKEYGRYHLAKHFPDGASEFQVRNNHYFTLGDNTLNSNDSRNWGDFPREKVIGKQFFVFWPITDRFGWHNR